VKVDSTLIELPLNAESFTQPEDSNLLDLVDQTQEETAGTSSDEGGIDLFFGQW
jgi:hypothetical protein